MNAAIRLGSLTLTALIDIVGFYDFHNADDAADTDSTSFVSAFYGIIKR